MNLGLINGFDILIEGLDKSQDNSFSIWQRNLTKSLDEAFELLSKIGQTSKNLIIALKNHIINSNTQEWYVVSVLLSLLENKLENQNVQTEIHNHIIEHFELIVKSPSDILEKYEWLKPTENTNTDIQLIELLIWFLNHPHLSLKQRVEEILIWASTIEPELYIPRIINEALLQKPQISSEICSLIILKLSKSSPEILAKALANTDLDIEVNHFVIKYNLMQAFFSIKQYSERISELYDKYNNSFSNIIQARGSCAFEEDYLLPVQEIIDKLDREYLLDGNICRYIDENINKLCKPIEKIEVVKTDNYIARSFFEEQFDVKQFGNYAYYLKYLINCSISKNVTKPQFEFAYELLKSY